jgi:hypothetical protein
MKSDLVFEEGRLCGREEDTGTKSRRATPSILVHLAIA